MFNHLLTTNPYDILEVSNSASNTEITKAFTLAMKRKKYALDLIAQARKSLLNQEDRLIADYLRPHLVTVKRFKAQDTSLLEKPVQTLDYLSQFDNLEEVISASGDEGKIDQKLGQNLWQNIK
ncbi:MAG: molecular chaperone DnaJ [Gloeocapsa sp. DLM2.Bin57]|nr:MAG: molecular chaperone DnaJ [Gloeocapsa sp. DLM2.Bin57]